MNEVRRACEALGDAPPTQGGFVRGLLRYPSWLVPASVDAHGASLVGVRAADGSVWLEVYSEHALLEAPENRAHYEKLPTKLLTHGVLWASLLGDAYAGVVIDPGAPWSRRLTAEQIPSLRRWSEALRLEDGLPLVSEALARHEASSRLVPPHAPPAILRSLVAYTGYLVLRCDDADDPYARTVPSRAYDHLPPFVVAFTAEDCAERFRAALSSPAAWRPFERTGRALFAEILERDEPGLALNTAGPGPTKTLEASALRTLLALEDPDA